VAADIPGLIEGASSGAGLGDRFLRHIERTRVLVHLLDCGAMLLEGRDLVSDYRAIRRELEHYRSDLSVRREVVVLNKVDLFPDREALADLESRLLEIGIKPLHISGVTGNGCRELVDLLLEEIEAAEKEASEVDSDAEGTGA